MSVKDVKFKRKYLAEFGSSDLLQLKSDQEMGFLLFIQRINFELFYQRNDVILKE